MKTDMMVLVTPLYYFGMETLCRYLNLQDVGQILGTGCGTVSMTKGTGFPRQAYELGKSL